MKWKHAFLACIALLVLAIVAWRFWSGKSETASGAAMVDVSVPELTALEREGRSAFANSCAGCHGDNAGGRDGIGPPLVHITYEPNHHGDAAFLQAARSGVRQHHWRFGDMPPVAGADEARIAAIVAYVRALQRANGIF
ncbi:MAG: cytochrome c [Pseudomonadota bacterium]|nr:cytochrome c [Pseudomonadota bacterium]